MSRSVWKGAFSAFSITKKIGVGINQQQVWSRSSMILPAYLGKQFQIYTGKAWIPINVIEEMVGKKFGEFASTRKKTIHKQKKLQQSSRNKKL